MTAITRIVVPTDFSTASTDARLYAKTMAMAFDASLHLVHAFEDPYTTAPFAIEAYAQVRETMLAEIERRLDEELPEQDRARVRGTAEVVPGPPARAIVDYAHARGADLIVMGTHGRGGMAHLLLGSVAERVVRTSNCPVLTVRESRPRGIHRILVPTDFSDTADAALDWARLLATRFGSSLQLLHVLDDPFVPEGLAPEAYIMEAPVVRNALLSDARTRLADRVAPLRRARVFEGGSGIARVDADVLFGDGAHTIAEWAEQRESDLIVMGTHGRRGVAKLVLGSVAEKLVRTAPCPVLTVRHAVRRTPPVELEYEAAHLPA
jgi:nucleotide-binding universal stress UspA family protein